MTGDAQGHQKQIVPTHPAAPKGEHIVRGKLAVRCEGQVLQQQALACRMSASPGASWL